MAICKLEILLLSFILLFCFSFKVSAQKQDVQTQEVIRLLNSYDAAWNKKDLAAVAKILAPNYIYFSSTGGTTSRQRTLDFLKSPAYKLTFAERIEITGFRTSNTVVIGSRWKGRGMYDKEEINDDQRCSLVFAKSEKQWKLVSEHCTQIVSK